MHSEASVSPGPFVPERTVSGGFGIVPLDRITALIVAVLVLLIPDTVQADVQGYPVSATIQLDAARKIGLGDVCPPPKGGSIRRASGTFTITLSGGDVGRCPGDDKENYGSAFRERAMINGINYPKRGHSYRFSALVRFDETARSADSTTFFEVHSG